MRASRRRSLPMARRPMASAPIATAPIASAPSAKEPSAKVPTAPAPSPAAGSLAAGSSTISRPDARPILLGRVSLFFIGVSQLDFGGLDLGRLGLHQRHDVVEHGLA